MTVASPRRQRRSRSTALLPYRDCWLLYGPLSGLLLAIPTAFLGPSIELIRALGFIVFCGEALVAYRLA